MRAVKKIDDPFARIGFLAFNRGIKFNEKRIKFLVHLGIMRSWPQPRKKWSQKMTRWFRSYLNTNIHSLKELRDFIDNELRPRGVVVENLISDFYEVVLQHLDWIQTKEDVEILTQSKLFWPTQGTLGVNPSKAEQALLDALKGQSSRYPAYWSVEPAAAEILHKRIVDVQKARKIYGKDFESQFSFWLTLSARGVTSVTDALFEELYKGADDEQKGRLEAAVDGGRIWDQPLKVGIVQRRVKRSPELALLRTEEDPKKREAPLAALIQMIQKELPERGLGYMQTLEDLSGEILSTPEESKLIEEAKDGSAGSSTRARDTGSRIFSGILDEVLTWTKDQQWNFILFLRGDHEADKFIQSQFASVGPERVRRMFQLLPIHVRATSIESFLASPRGLLPTCEPRSPEVQRIMGHLLKNGSEASQEIGRQILEAFLFSLQDGLEKDRAYVLSYLLSMLKSNEENSVGYILKNVLEVFGGTGVKIGQILAATELLPESENKYLYELQEQANIPSRNRMYTDLREHLPKGEALDRLPYRILERLGAASLKYAVKATPHGEIPSPSSELALKILREEGIAHTQEEFTELKLMGDYLVNYGPRFGVLRAIFKAARKAVERELDLGKEAANSSRAARTIYARSPLPEVEVRVPVEFTIGDRIMASEFAPGGSFRNLDPGLLPFAAKGILSIETENLFQGLDAKGRYVGNLKDEIDFDPDRHAGNYRLRILPDGRLSIRPLDFGQMLTMTKGTREQIFDLFALSQILKRSRATRWGAEQAARILGLTDPWAVDRIFEKLEFYFTKELSKTPSKVSPYYHLLAALDDAGFEQDIVFFDYIRSMTQLGQYRKHLAPEDVERLDPHSRLTKIVEVRAAEMLQRMKREIKTTDRIRGRIILHKLNKIERAAKPTCMERLRAVGGIK